MLSVAEEYLHELNPDARLEVFGQEINPESYAICKSDMLIKGQNPHNIKFGNTFTQDGLEGEVFDYMLSNPPFGVDWKKAEKYIKDEAANKGFAGRFGAGLRPISDGSLLFLQHMISKMKRSTGGSRIGIVFNGSPLFSGGAGSGPSEIRKRKEIYEEAIKLITKIYGEFKKGPYCKIFDNDDFGYRRITVERPKRDEKGNIEKDRKGNPLPDADLRDFENVPLKEDVGECFNREVLPHVPDAWIDHSKTKVGYEINFTKYFYKYKPLRSLEEIRRDILAIEVETEGMISDILE